MALFHASTRECNPVGTVANSNVRIYVFGIQPEGGHVVDEMSEGMYQNAWYS